jgi:DNA-binding transcriptional LysR family regulator
MTRIEDRPSTEPRTKGGPNPFVNAKYFATLPHLSVSSAIWQFQSGRICLRFCVLPPQGNVAEVERSAGCKRDCPPEELQAVGAGNHQQGEAAVLRAVTEDYLRRCGLDIKLDHGVDNMAMAISLVASTRGLALMPAYAKNLLPWSVVSRPLVGEAPTIDLAVGYSDSNTSPILKLFLSRIEQLTDRISSETRPRSTPESDAAPR